jgi:tetratricopeptide (TPR) repeat protein
MRRFLRFDPLDPDWRYRWKDTSADIDPEKVRGLEVDFLLDFLESALEHHPDNTDVLFELGCLYTDTGRYEDGLAVDRRLSRLLPDNPTVHYNLACSLALVGEKDKALKALRGAIRRGFSEFEKLREDPDLSSLRGEPEFQALLELSKETLS